MSRALVGPGGGLVGPGGGWLGPDPDVTGTGASAFGFSTEATGPGFTASGDAASAFGFSADYIWPTLTRAIVGPGGGLVGPGGALVGPDNVGRPTGIEDIPGSGASAFGWSAAGTAFTNYLEEKVLLTSDGEWVNLNDAKFYTYNNITYITFVNEAGDIYIASYDEIARTTSAPFLLGSGYTSPSGNIHNSISVLVRSSDKRLLVAMHEEGGNPDFRLSTNPEDVSAWGAVYNPLTSGVYTYSTLNQMADESGAIYFWATYWTGGFGRLGYAKSTDGGATFGATHSVVSPTSTTVIFHRVGTDQAGRQHLFFTNTDRDTPNPSSVYHAYMEGGSFYKSDGTLILAAQPFAASAGQLVHNAADGSAHPEGWGIATDGSPAVVVQVGYVTDASKLIRVARFDGATWSHADVVYTPGYSVGMEKADPNRVWVTVGTSQLLYLYTSADDGVTWTGEQKIPGGALVPETPLNQSALRVAWYNGVTIRAWVENVSDAQFGWSTASSSVFGDNEGTAASAFGWSTAADGFSGDRVGFSVDVVFGWSTAATGSVHPAGEAASAFGWSTSAAGSTITAAAASSFGFATASAGIVALNAAGASEFGWSTGQGGGTGATGNVANGGVDGDGNPRDERIWWMFFGRRGAWRARRY